MLTKDLCFGVLPELFIYSLIVHIMGSTMCSKIFTLLIGFIQTVATLQQNDNCRLKRVLISFKMMSIQCVNLTWLQILSICLYISVFGDCFIYTIWIMEKSRYFCVFQCAEHRTIVHLRYWNPHWVGSDMKLASYLFLCV